MRACRQAIEFNSIPCIWEVLSFVPTTKKPLMHLHSLGGYQVVPGGRPNMLIKIRLGVPSGYKVCASEDLCMFVCTPPPMPHTPGGRSRPQEDRRDGQGTVCKCVSRVGGGACLWPRGQRTGAPEAPICDADS